LKPYRERGIKYLEIGVHLGGGLEAMSEIFDQSHKSLTVGLDIRAECKKIEQPNKNIFVEIGNAANRTFLQELVTKYGSFDVIIDDGSNINTDVQVTFELLFPTIRDNGLYIVENSAAFKSIENEEGLDHLQYFAQFLQYLNQNRQLDSINDETKDQCGDPYKIEKEAANIFEASIDKIEFGVNYIAIHKKYRYHWMSK
jgi:hypothetical protein